MFPEEEIEKQYAEVIESVMKQVQQICNEQKLSNAELSKDLGVCRSTASDFRNGNTAYNIKPLVRFGYHTHHTITITFTPN